MKARVYENKKGLLPWNSTEKVSDCTDKDWLFYAFHEKGLSF